MGAKSRSEPASRGRQNECQVGGRHEDILSGGKLQGDPERLIPLVPPSPKPEYKPKHSLRRAWVARHPPMPALETITLSQ